MGSGAALVAALSGVQPNAALAGDKNTIGNGSNNHNAVSINSPTSNKGPVAISNANAGGHTSTRAALCKWKRHCVIVQR